MPPSASSTAPSSRRPFPTTTSIAVNGTRPTAPSSSTAITRTRIHTVNPTGQTVFDRLYADRPTANAIASTRTRLIPSSTLAAITEGPILNRPRPIPRRPLPATTCPSPTRSTRPRSPASSQARNTTRPVPSGSSAMFGQSTERAFRRPQTNYLTGKVEIEFESNGTVEMIGGAMTGSSYSLAGHVRFTLPSISTGTDGRGRIRRIKDLVIRAEGKSEYHDEEGRYVPMRLYKSSVRIATNDSRYLIPTIDPSRAKSGSVVLAIPFDMRLPGWLPPSHVTERTETSYGIRADITIGWLDDSSLIGAKRNVLSNPSLSPDAIGKSVSPFTAFRVQRHLFPVNSHGQPTKRPLRSHTLRAASAKTTPIDCIVTVPDWIDTNGGDRSLRLSLQVRARPEASTIFVETATDAPDRPRPTTVPSVGIAASRPSGDNSAAAEPSTPSVALSPPVSPPSCPSSPAPSTGSPPAEIEHPVLRLTELGLEVDEHEHFSSQPYQSFGSLYPLPRQPGDKYDFISPKPHYAAENTNKAPFKGVRHRRCLLSSEGKQRNFIFEDDELALDQRWRKINIILPMPSLEPSEEDKPGGRPQSELSAPFIQVHHALKLKIVLQDPDINNKEIVLLISTPLNFGTAPSTLPGPAPASRLPAYVQVFHENGELRECDPLPLYAARANDADPATPGRALPPAPSYKSLFPDETPSRSASPSPASARLRSPSPAGSSSSAETAMTVVPTATTETTESPVKDSPSTPIVDNRTSV